MCCAYMYMPDKYYLILYDPAYILLYGYSYAAKLEMSSVTTYDCSLHLYHPGRCYRTTIVGLPCDHLYQFCSIIFNVCIHVAYMYMQNDTITSSEILQEI